MGVPSPLECRCGVWLRPQDSFSTTTSTATPFLAVDSWGWGGGVGRGGAAGLSPAGREDLRVMGQRTQCLRLSLAPVLVDVCEVGEVCVIKVGGHRIWGGAFGTPERLINLAL